MLWPAFIAVGLACGSIPFGLLIARSRGLDIRKHGSGNIGATNVARILGPRLGLLCFALDGLKGFIPTFTAGLAAGLVHASIVAQPIAADQSWCWLAVLAACILGHMFSPFVGFRGGKGVATSFGAMLGLWPYLAFPALGALAVWLIAAAISRYISLASCLAAISLPVWVFAGSQLARGGAADLTPYYVVTVGMALLVVFKHRGNIRRLVAGTENRLGQRVDPRASPRP